MRRSRRRMSDKSRCPGSHGVQMLAWPPTENNAYPGAAVCLHCSKGVPVLRGSVHPAVSESGHEGLAGSLRVHRPN
jgi:hypothetical protein